MAISTTFTLKFAGAAVERGLARVQSAFKSLGGVAMRVGKSLLSPFAALTALFGAGALTAGLVSFVKGSSAAAASVEDLTIQLEVLTGSLETAKSLIEQFRNEEKKSALNLEDYSTAAKTILAFGGSIEDIMPTLKMLGDVSMGNSDRFGSLALAFAQTTAAGRLMGQEVLQFVNAGFNPLEQISRDTGRSMKDLKKEMEDGAISVAMVRAAFINATSEGGRFYRAIDKGSASTSAKINQFSAAVTQLKVAFGTGFNDGLKIALDAANTKLPELLAKFAEFGTLIGKTISDAVNGDFTRFFMIGNMIGEAVMEGMRLVIESKWVKLGQFMNREILGGTEFFTTEKSRARDKVNDEADRKQLLEGGLSDFMQEMKSRYGEALALPTALPQRSGAHPNMPGVSYAPEGYSGRMVDEKGHRIMFDIKTGIDSLNQKLSPVP